MSKIQYYIAWWNVENLFSVADDPLRDGWLQDYLENELKGWTAEVLSKKIAQLSKVIQLMNEGKGPDILGVCEVENERVLQQLVDSLAPLGKNYGIAEQGSDDKRGIDVAFIYDKEKFSAEEKFTRRIVKRYATRDILQVNFKTMAGKDLILLGNHWPARMPGVYETEPYRILAGETLAYWMERIAEIKGVDSFTGEKKDVHILVVGDFNDEPFSRSVVDYALCSHSKVRVSYSRTVPRTYNLMAKEMGKGIGSFYYGGPCMFDQIMASSDMIKTTSALKVKDETASVCKFQIMRYGGGYEGPKRFGRPSKKSEYDPEGFSDHFPVSVIIEEKIS